MHRKDRDIEEQKGIHELRGIRKPEMVQEESTLKNFYSGNNRVQGRSTRNTGLVQLNNCAITKHIYE